MNSFVEEHLLRLKTYFPSANAMPRPDGSAKISIQGFRLPPGWNSDETNVVFIAPVGYPMARPDCFWTSKELALASGAPPANSAINNNYGEPDPMRWFSFHASKWDPNRDDILTFTMLVRRRLSDAR